MIQIMDENAFTENAVYHSPCITKYLLKYTPLNSECMGNEGSYSSEHDTAFKSLIPDIDEDLTIHKKVFFMTQLLNYLKNICLICPIISLRHTMLLNYRTKLNISMVIRLLYNHSADKGSPT